MSNKELLDQIKDLAKQAETMLNGREYFLGDVVGRLQVAASKYPHDQAIRSMQRVLEQKLGKEGAITSINQTEVQSLYDDVSGLGNREAFKEELGDLLAEDRVSKVANYNDSHVRGLRDSGEQIEIANQADVSALEGLWSDEPGLNVVKSSFVENGRKGVAIELESLGFINPAVEIAAKNSNFVVYAAEVDTRNGRVPFMIPAEIKLGSVLMPSIFVSGNEFKDLNALNLKAYVNNVASVEGSSTPKGVLDTLNRITGMEDTVSVQADYGNGEMSDIIPEGPAFFMDHIGHTDASLNDVREIDDKMAAVELPPALVGLGESLIRETLVEAGLSYPRDTVLSAKQLVSNELRMANIVHDTIVVDSEFAGGITLATNITGKGGKKRIDVPVEVISDQVLMPNSFTSGAMAGLFNEDSLRSFANKIDGEKFDPFLSDKYDMNFNDLHKTALNKAAYGDFIEATEILSIINDKFGHDFHKIAHDDLMDLMRVGYCEEAKPLTAMEQFAKEAAAAAEERAQRMSMSNNAMLFYPGE